MARVKMVTRTVTTIKAVVKVANLDTNTIEEVEVIVPEQANEKLFNKVLKEAVNNEHRMLITCLSTESIETLYGMPETDFIKNAVVLPKREKVEA